MQQAATENQVHTKNGTSPIVGTEVVSATDVLQYGDLKFAISVERLRLDLLQSFDF